MNLVKSKLKYEEKKKQEQEQKQKKLYSTRYSIQAKGKKTNLEDPQSQEEEEYEEEEEELKEQYQNIKKLWNDLGVTKEFQNVFGQLSKKLSKKLKKDCYDYETSQLNKFRDNLIKLSKNITSREKTIYLLKELDINYFQEITKDKPNTSTIDKITGDIVQAIKHLRIHSVNAVNHMAKVRDICSYNIICGKYDLDKINKVYFFDKNYLIKMKFDLDFLKDTHLAELFEFSEESDPFLLNLSPDEEEIKKEKEGEGSKISQGVNTEDIEKKNEENQETNEQKKKDEAMEEGEKEGEEEEEKKKKKKIPMTLDLLNACKQCEFIIMQDLLFYQIQSEKAEQEAKSKKPEKIKLGQSFKGNLTQSINKNRKKREYEMLFYQSQIYKKGGQERKKDEIQPMTSEELLEKLDEYERKTKNQPMTAEEFLEKLDEYERKQIEDSKKEEEKEIQTIQSEEEKKVEEEARKKEEEERKREEEKKQKEEEEERKRKEEEAQKEEERKRKEEEAQKEEEEEERKRKEEEKQKEEEEKKKNEYQEGDELLHIEDKIVFNKNKDKEDKEMEKQIKYEEQTLQNFEKYYGKPEPENEEKTQSNQEEKREKNIEQYMNKSQTIREEGIQKDKKEEKEEDKKEEKKEEENKKEDKIEEKEEEKKEEKKEEENKKEDKIEEKKEEDKLLEEVKYDEEEKQTESMKKNEFSNLHPQDFKVSYFTKEFSFFIRDYNEYYSEISEEQKTTFHLENDTSLFTIGISPKILYCHSVNEPNKLVGVCGISLSHPISSVTKLNINHISALGDDWASIFKAFIMFITENFKYNEINLLLYYKINKNITYEINKEIMSLFKDELKFKWSKIENPSDEMRRQEIILLSEKSDNESKENDAGAMNIKINSVISLGKKTNSLSPLDLNSKYINEFLAVFAVNVLKNSSYKLQVSNSENNKLINWEIECVKKFLTYTNLDFEATTDMSKVKNALGEEIEIPEDSDEVTYVKYGLLPQLYSNITSKYDGFIYNRLEIETFGILKDKQNDVTIYVIPTSDRSISILICEVTRSLQKLLFENYSSNLYEKFNLYVESINNEEKVNDKKYIWLPSFDIDTHLSSPSLQCLSDITITKNDEKANVINVDEYLKMKFKGDDKIDVGFIVEPQEEDIVIKNSFLFAIANDGVCKNLNIPVIALMNITKDNWIKA